MKLNSIRCVTWLTAVVALISSAPFSGLGKPPRPPRDAASEARVEADLDGLIRWLLAGEREHELVELPFAAVVRATTGHQVLPFDKTDATDAAVLEKVSGGMDEVLRRMNAPDSPARRVKRINEASHFFENAMQEVFNALPGLRCEFAPNPQGKVQRSGYPDLRVIETASGRVYYFDPKLLESHSRRSSFRTFYFEPRVETNKILADARHFVVGIAHNGDPGDEVRFLSWEIVDCSGLKVRLKAEFSASNHDLYQPGAIVAEHRLAAEEEKPKAAASPTPATTAEAPSH